MKSGVDNVTKTMSEQYHNIEGTVSQINNISLLVKEVSEAVQEQAKVSDNVVTLTDELSKSNEKGMNLIKDVGEASDKTSNVAQKLKEFTDSFKV